MSTMLHAKIMPLALGSSANDTSGIRLQCQLSAVLVDDVNDETGLR